MLLNEYQAQAMRTDGDDNHYAKSGLAHAVENSNPVVEDIHNWFGVIAEYGDRIDKAKKQLVYKTFNTPAIPEDDTGLEKIGNLRALHALMLLTSEVGELSVGFVNGDKMNEAEELGDILWGVALYAKSRGLSLEQCAKANIAKLSARYPGKFSTEQALNRDKSAEKDALAAELKTP